jgi:hypothetical protein
MSSVWHHSVLLLSSQAGIYSYASFSPRIPGFSAEWLQVRFVFDEVAYSFRSFLSCFFCLPLGIIIHPLLHPLVHTHVSPPHEVFDSPDQAAHYHIIGRKLGASSLTRHVAGLGVKASNIISVVTKKLSKWRRMQYDCYVTMEMHQTHCYATVTITLL